MKLGARFSYAMSNLKIEFIDKEITAWGGIAILQKMMEKMSFSEVLKNAPLPMQGSNRGYHPGQLITQFIISIWCGASRYEHLEVIRFDGVIQQMFGWKSMAAHRALFVTFRSSLWKIMQKFLVICISGFLTTLPLTTSHLT
jgi:hypothetical protein